MVDHVKSRPRRQKKEPIRAEVALSDWGPRGSAWADLDGGRVAIDRGIPGEQVEATVRPGRGTWRGVVENVLHASPLRITAPCPYFHAGCGGCQWQHVSYAGQLAAKRQLAERELRACGIYHPVAAVHGMDEPWCYRRTASIAVGWEAGFRPRGRRGIVEIHDCAIAHPGIGRLAAQLNEILRQNLLPNYHGKVWLDCTVVDGDTGPALQVVIQAITGLTPERNPDLPDVAAVIARLDGVQTVAYRHRSGEVIPLIGPLLGTIHVAGVPLRVPAGAFFQTNLVMLEQLVGRMHEVLGEQRLGAIADIYGGVGTFAFALASSADQVTLIELDPQAVAAARETAELSGITNVTCLSDHAERALPALGPLDLAVVDPPRSGLGEKVVDALAASAVPVIFYISCSPASLARDLAGLQEHGFTIRSIELFDFYPQTYHVESLTVLAR